MNASFPSPEQKRPVLHRFIDELPAEDLELAERLLARLEVERVWRDVREGFSADWKAGKYARLDELIREARADLKQRAG